MSATDELRAMLDERGVEHFDGCENTLWGYEQTSESTGIYRYSADEISGSFVNVWLHHCTPEQAIAATLGKEPDDTTMLKLHDRMNAELLEYERALGSEKADGAITVPFVAEMHRLLEEAAMLGSCSDSCNCTNSERTGTCHDVGDPSDFCCSECGIRMFTDTSDTYTMIASDGRTIIKRPNYCPNCGRRCVG